MATKKGEITFAYSVFYELPAIYKVLNDTDQKEEEKKKPIIELDLYTLVLLIVKEYADICI